MVVVYFTKWFEKEPVAKIISRSILHLFKMNTYSVWNFTNIVTNNEIQLTDQRFKELMDNMQLAYHFTLVEHLQINGQVELTNKVLLRGLRRRLNNSKENWAKKPPYVL